MERALKHVVGHRRPACTMSFTGQAVHGKNDGGRADLQRSSPAGWLCAQGPSVTANRDDLRRPVHRHTARENRAKSQRAMGGVLFIDEAYYLYPRRRMNGLQAPSDRDPAAGEWRTTATSLVVIFAGYKDRYGCLLSVPTQACLAGVAKPHRLSDYSAPELLAIPKGSWAARLSLQRRGQCGLADTSNAHAAAFLANARSIAIDLRSRMRQGQPPVQPPRAVGLLTNGRC